MKKKGFFGYGRCPNCDAFLKEKDLVKNTCWKCKGVIKKSNVKQFTEGTYKISMETFKELVNINILSLENDLIKILNESNKDKLSTDISNFISKFLEKYYSILKNSSPLDGSNDWFDYGRFYLDLSKAIKEKIGIDLTDSIKYDKFYKSLPENEKEWLYKQLKDVDAST